MSALCMAIFLRGCSNSEIAAMTLAMAESGTVADYSQLEGDARLVDKHSTGGVGDKVSLVLAPLVASFGLRVPMMTGRGLGHTGGTLDKLESIPGFNSNLTTEHFMDQLQTVGCCMFAPTADIAPVDKTIYALRDVTGTTESLPLIGSSIMSKKIAENPDALTLDVKTGRGAFLQDWEQSLALAEVMVAAGEGAGIPTIAFLTSMEQPLGYTVGNWLEAKEAIETLNGHGPADIEELCVVQAAQMLLQGGCSTSFTTAKDAATEHLRNGAALQKFKDIVTAQGGDVAVIDDPQSVGATEFEQTFVAQQAGVVTGIDPFEIGLTSVGLGAGRQTVEDNIDPAAGFVFHRKIGDEVAAGDPVFTAYSESEALLIHGMQRASAAIEIGPPGSTVSLPPLISHVMDSTGICTYTEHLAK